MTENPTDDDQDLIDDPIDDLDLIDLDLIDLDPIDDDDDSIDGDDDPIDDDDSTDGDSADGDDPIDILQYYMRDVGSFSLLDPEEEKRLARRIEEGQGVLEARNQLVVANLRLVVHIAKRNKGRGHAHGLDLLDLIQEGNLGLLRAAEKFESGYGKFSTFATRWVQGKINQALAAQGRVIRMPRRLHKSLVRLRKMESRFLAEMGRPPTPKELAAKLGIDTEDLAELRGAEMEVVSLEQPATDDEEESICEELAMDPESTVFAQRVVDRQWLAAVLAPLDERRRRILEGHFVFGREFVEIASQENVSRERIRQIVRDALKKLAPVAEMDG